MDLKKRFSEKNSYLERILTSKPVDEPSELTIHQTDRARDIIGRFTTGYFGYRRARGVGIAFADQKKLKNLEILTQKFLDMDSNHLTIPKGFKAIALTRKNSSQFYHFCILKF